MTAQGSTTSIEAINFNLKGFPLRGAYNDGTCYFVKDLVQDDGKNKDSSKDLTKLTTLIENASQRTYFEDPVLTFEDSMVYGCSL